MKLYWVKCSCGHASCEYEQPTNLGSFYQGTGFTPEEKEMLDRAFAALEKQERNKKRIASIKKGL